MNTLSNAFTGKIVSALATANIIIFINEEINTICTVEKWWKENEYSPHPLRGEQDYMATLSA